MADHVFDDYLAMQPEPQRSTLRSMAASLRKILPGAQERMSYGMPAFAVDGTSIAGLAGFKGHCSYFPHSGAVLEQLAADLVGYDFDQGTLRFPVDAPLPPAPPKPPKRKRSPLPHRPAPHQDANLHIEACLRVATTSGI